MRLLVLWTALRAQPRAIFTIREWKLASSFVQQRTILRRGPPLLPMPALLCLRDTPDEMS
jgi:hypothetical protein